MSEKLNTSETRGGRINLKRTMSTLAAAAIAMGTLAGCNDEKVGAAPESVETTQSEVITEEVILEEVEEITPQEETQPAAQESEGISPEGLPYSIDRNGFVRIPEEYVTVAGREDSPLLVITNPEHSPIVKAYPEAHKDEGYLKLSVTLRGDVYRDKVYYSEQGTEWGEDGSLYIENLEDWMMTERQLEALKSIYDGRYIVIEFESHNSKTEEYTPFHGDVFTPVVEQLPKYSVVSPTGAIEPLSGTNTVSNLIIFNKSN